ncbi:MAG: hypothetical protein LBG59_07950 [Candidatus Peribacteria bacterium]|jgi:hypothetical protein|nr:hypothetical protein [Candidatus Peribacteria bacterium]
MEKELKDLEIQLATEQKLYVDVNNERVSMEKDFTSILSDQIEERKREQQDYTKTVEAETKKQLSIAENAALKMQEYARQYQATLASVNSFDS